MNRNSLLTTSEVAQRLGIVRQTAARYIREGRLRSYRLGNRFRVDPNELTKFMQAAAYRPPEFSVPRRVSDDERVRILESVLGSSRGY